MEDTVTEVDPVRNEIIEHIIATKPGVPPFTYVAKMGDKYIHYKLKREPTTQRPFITEDVARYTLQVLAETLWCRNPSYTHGDITINNVEVMDGILYIVDFEPGLCKKNNLENALEFIFEDIFDFLRTIREINQQHGDFELYQMFPELTPYNEILVELIDNGPTDIKELSQTMLGVVLAICPQLNGRRGGKSRKRIR